MMPAKPAGQSMPRQAHRVHPNDEILRVRQRGREDVHDAISRAKTLPWWPRVRSRTPVLASGWWCWIGRAP